MEVSSSVLENVLVYFRSYLSGHDGEILWVSFSGIYTDGVFCIHTLGICMYIHKYICIFKYIYIYLCTHTHIYIFMTVLQKLRK